MLAPRDPGPGPLELSVRISRRELNQAAQRRGMSGTVLLRRLIAAQLEPPEVPKGGSTPQANTISNTNAFLRGGQQQERYKPRSQLSLFHQISPPGNRCSS